MNHNFYFQLYNKYTLPKLPFTMDSWIATVHTQKTYKLRNLEGATVRIECLPFKFKNFFVFLDAQRRTLWTGYASFKLTSNKHTLTIVNDSDYLYPVVTVTLSVPATSGSKDVDVIKRYYEKFDDPVDFYASQDPLIID